MFPSLDSRYYCFADTPNYYNLLSVFWVDSSCVVSSFAQIIVSVLVSFIYCWWNVSFSCFLCLNSSKHYNPAALVLYSGAIGGADCWLALFLTTGKLFMLINLFYCEIYRKSLKFCVTWMSVEHRTFSRHQKTQRRSLTAWPSSWPIHCSDVCSRTLATALINLGLLLLSILQKLDNKTSVFLKNKRAVSSFCRSFIGYNCIFTACQ